MNILSNISFGVPQKKETLWVWNNMRSEQMMRRGEDGPMGSTDLLCRSLKTGLPLQTPLSLLSRATGVMFLGHRTHLQHPTVHPCINVANTTKQCCVCACTWQSASVCVLSLLFPPPPPLFLSRDICSRNSCPSKIPKLPPINPALPLSDPSVCVCAMCIRGLLALKENCLDSTPPL